MQNADRLDSEIIYMRDFDYDYFGFKVRLSSLWSTAFAYSMPPLCVCQRVIQSTIWCEAVL